MKIAQNPQAQQQDLSSTEFLTTRTEDINRLMNIVADLICPIGVPLPYYSILGVPEGFIKLDGRWLPTADYPRLSAMWGKYFGLNLATGQFRTPNLSNVYLPSTTMCPPTLGVDMFITRAR